MVSLSKIIVRTQPWHKLRKDGANQEQSVTSTKLNKNKKEKFTRTSYQERTEKD